METFQNFRRLTRVFTKTLHYIGEARTEKPIDSLMKAWAKESIENLGVDLKVFGAAPAEVPTLLVGNHISYLDIPVIMAIRPVVFVAKEELGKWPVIGAACRSVGTVFVKRECGQSRKNAAKKIADAIIVDKKSICVFPSGTTTVDEIKPWKRGVFQIARDFGIPIQPFRLRYNPNDIAAFIGDDALVPHLWRLLRTGRIEANVELLPPMQVTSPESDCEHLWNWTRAQFSIPI
jgi:lyso-ornithine lipid O-acyltransferase